MTDIDDLPELEEFNSKNEAVIENRISNNNTIKINVINNSKNEDNKAKDNLKNTKSCSKTNSNNNVNNNFGLGMKKGFLLNKSNTNNKKSNNKVIDLTHIKYNKSNENNNIKDTKDTCSNFDKLNKDIKDASSSNEFSSANSSNLYNNIINKKEEWMNDEFFKKLINNKNLIKYFSNPKINEVISLLSTNPQKAKELYGNNAEFNDFFKEFNSFMGNHFQELSKSKEKIYEDSKKIDNNTDTNTIINKNKNELDELRKSMKQLSLNYKNDEQVYNAINDTEVQYVILYIQKLGMIDLNAIKCSEVTKRKIKLLLDKGFFKVLR